MALQMDKLTFLSFYRSTMLGYSKSFQNYALQLMKRQESVSFDPQLEIAESPSVSYFEKEKAISETSVDPRFSGFYEQLEFFKLFKYSVPFFYKLCSEKTLSDSISSIPCTLFSRADFKPNYILATSIDEESPMYLVDGSDIYLKFILQKHFYTIDDGESVEYRFPVVIYFNESTHILEIRYDNPRHDPDFSKGDNKILVLDCIKWIKEHLEIQLFTCEHANLISTIKNDPEGDTKIYKQMMELKSGGSAELTASADRDYVLPFTGELRELIAENDELFTKSPEIRDLLLQYLEEKEVTANYPYVYIKRVKPVETNSYIVKITFDFIDSKFTLLQHITGDCKDLGKERMNDAIQYLCESGSFTQGSEV